jgi:Protein of unknown function (DUF3306)
MQNSDDDKKPFLSRWSQRKLAAEQERVRADLPLANEAGGLSADAKAGSASGKAGDASKRNASDIAQKNTAPVALPTIDSVNLESGVAPFFKQQADESLRRLALKKLLSDPHFNIMDGLDIYVGDYSQPDPIPPEMMKKIRHARQWTMTPEEIVEAEKVDVEEEIALKLKREAWRVQEEKLAAEEKLAREEKSAAEGTLETEANLAQDENLVLEQHTTQKPQILQSNMKSELERPLNAELHIEKQTNKK